MYRRALAGREKVLGPEHNLTLQTVNKIYASCTGSRGNGRRRGPCTSGRWWGEKRRWAGAHVNPGHGQQPMRRGLPYESEVALVRSSEVACILAMVTKLANREAS
jgi:hypothetical protein